MPQSAAVERAARRLIALAKEEPEKKERIPALVGGIRTNKPSDALADNESPSIINMLVLQGQLQPDSGYVPLGSGPIVGVPCGIFEINHSGGNQDIILVTTKTAYYLNRLGVWTGGTIALNGDISIPTQSVSYAPFDWIVITNGVDPVFYFALGQFQFIRFDLNGIVCRSVAVFHESLLLIGTTELGVKNLRRVRMSDIGNPTAIKTIIEGASTGIAAIYDLLDTDDDLHCAYTLGPWLILYRHSSIMRATYLGVLNNTLFWEYMITGDGSLSVGSVCPITIAEKIAYHILLGNQNVYRYRGDYSLEPIGNAIWQSELSATSPLNQLAQSTIWSQFISQQHEVWIGIPIYESTMPNSVLRLSLDTEQHTWYMRKFADPILGVGAPLSRFEENLSASNILLAGPNGVYQYDYVSLDDNGQPINWSFQTKDIGDGGTVSRFDRLVVRGTGMYDIGVEASMDGGDSWEFLDTINFDFDAVALLTFNLTGEYMRLRLSGTDQLFKLTWLEVRYTYESEWTPIRGTVRVPRSDPPPAGPLAPTPTIITGPMGPQGPPGIGTTNFVELVPGQSYQLPSTTTIGTLYTIIASASAAASPHVISAQPGVNINGLPTYSLNQNNASISLYWNGTQWRIF